ncbi:MAG TPA: DUF2076 domain-containing protein [Terracidiphilus sp.]|nr:DUF2076 domain-containing protein [Terracidiphilus sp.]
MTPQEEQLLNSLVERVNQTQLQEKDPEAEALLGQALGRNPDALYILAQTVLVQNIALEQARAQVTQLQQQAQQPRQPAHATSFLGRLLGERDNVPARQNYPVPQQGYPGQPGYAGQPGYGQPAPAQSSAPMTGYQPVNPQYAQAPPYGPGYGDPQYMPMAGGPPSFLRGAMQTAAGVAAGALAFEGVESILHGFGHPGMGFGGPGYGMGGMMGAGFERPVEETVVNNYYDDPQGRGAEHGGMEHEGERHFHETADQGGAQYSDASYNTGDDRNELDAANADDSANYDNSTQDDGGSGFDDSGSFDDGGGGSDSGGDSF